MSNEFFWVFLFQNKLPLVNCKNTKCIVGLNNILRNSIKVGSYLFWVKSSYFLNPIHHVGHTGVNTRVDVFTTTNSPRHHTNLSPMVTIGDHERSTAVTLKKQVKVKTLFHFVLLAISYTARIFALFSSTQHGFGDSSRGSASIST